MNENSLQTGARWAKNAAIGYVVFGALGPRIQLALILVIPLAIMAALGAFGGILFGLVITGAYNAVPTDDPEVVYTCACIGALILVSHVIYSDPSFSVLAKRVVTLTPPTDSTTPEATAQAAARKARNERISKAVDARLAREAVREEAQAAIVPEMSGIAVEPPVELFTARKV